MPQSDGARARPEPWETEGRFRRVMWSLAIAETLVWAGMYYSFPALIARFEADFGWSKTDLALAFTLALVASASLAPLAGRQIDRGRGRAILTVSASCGGVLLILLTLVETRWQFLAVWVLLGCAMSGCLYEPCFAYVTRTRGGRAARGITLITLVAGFAGTVSFPVGNLVADAAGWRASILVFAVLIFAVAVPLFWFSTRGDPRPEPAVPRLRGAGGGPSHLRQTLARPAFWLLAAAFALVACNHGMILTQLMPLLAERRLSTEMAVLTASMIGPMQVAGRIGMIGLQRLQVSMLVIGGLTFILMTGASLSLLAAAALPLLLIPFVAFQGSGWGVTSITRPVVTAELLGRADFGAISGSLAVAYIGAFAVGPMVAAWIWGLAGYGAVVAAAAGMAATGLVAYMAALRLARPRLPHP